MDPTLALGAAAAVLVAAALAAGVIARGPVSFPLLFLGLGLLLGPGLLDVVTIDLDAPLLTIVAVMTLSLVLFLDAVNLDVEGLRRDWWVPALALGPGTLLTIALVTTAGVLLFAWSWPVALVAGAALASTDAVTLRDTLRDERLPYSLRRSLAVEAGTNDLIILPVLLVAIAVATGQATGALGWTWFAVQLLVIGPATGAAVGLGGARLMAWVDARTTVPREHQSIYGVALVLVAFAVGELVGGSGFLAAFAAGLAVSVANTDLCDCVLDLGQVAAEILLLAAFVLFGIVLSAQLQGLPPLAGLALGLVVLFVARPVAVGGVLALARTSLSGRAIALFAWFGPRGLASLLLALLAVQAGVPGAEPVFAAVGGVVALSVVLHGTTSTPLAGLYARREAGEVRPEDRAISATDALRHVETDEVPRIDVDELLGQLAGADPPVIVDVRTDVARRVRPRTIPGSLWVPPEAIERWLEEDLPHGPDGNPRPLVLWCTCREEATAARVAAAARHRGVDAVALRGGLSAWERAGQPVGDLPVPTPS